MTRRRDSWRAFTPAWFARHQAVLLAVLAEPLLGRVARWLLRIRRDDIGWRRPIVQLCPHAYVVANSDGSRTADVRTHWKYAKRVYYSLWPVWWLMHAWDWAVGDRVPASWAWVPNLSFGFLTLTQYPDPGEGATTVDGSIRLADGVDLPWATMIAAAAGTSADHISNSDPNRRCAYVATSATTDQFGELRRSMFLFDTSMLTFAAVISSAVMSIYGVAKRDNLSLAPTIDVYATTPAATTTLAIGDFSEFGSVSQTGSPITYAAYSTSGYNAFALNATGIGAIAPNGVTKFGTRLANCDVSGVAPSWFSLLDAGFDCQFAENTGTSQDPKLEVTYTVASGVLDSMSVELELDGVWTDVSQDLVSAEALSIRYGIWDRHPMARVASTGSCRFTLRNDAGCSGGLGYHSPGHANVRPGFTRGVRCRVTFELDGEFYQKFTGKVFQIDPEPGQFTLPKTHIVAYDWMDDLAAFPVRAVTPQEGKTADELIDVVLDAMPSDAQPVARALDAGVDTYPYAFDDLGAGANGLALIADVVRSDLGYLFARGDGTVLYRNRHALLSAPVAIALTDAELNSLQVPSQLDQAFNLVRTTAHPKRTPNTTIVLWAKASTDVPSVAAGETKVIWVEYRDPANEDLLIGGQAGQFVTPASGTDYVANAAPDGSGSNLTANIAVSATFFASTAKLDITNSGGSVAYLTTLQIRGKGIYDLSPVTYESSSVQTYGQRTLDVDLTYQADGNVAQDMATYLRAQLETLNQRPEVCGFIASRSPALLLHAMAREPGDRIRITETVTGIAAAEAQIVGVELTITAPLFVRCAWATAPAFVSDAWILDDPVRSILDSTTVLGFV